MNAKTPWLLLGLFALVSCTPTSHPDLRVFPFTDDPDNPYLSRNGDNYGKSGISYAYQETTLDADAEEIAKRLECGESVLLFLHQDSCHSCTVYHDNLTHFFLESGASVFGIDFSEVSTGMARINAIKDKFPGIANTFPAVLSTPTMYMIKSTAKAYPVEFSTAGNDKTALENFFKERMNFSLVYDFTSYSAYTSFIKDNDCLTYVGEASPLQTFYPLAYHKAKPLARFNIVSATEEDAASMKAFIGEDSVAKIVGGAVEEKASSDSEEALALINRYYA